MADTFIIARDDTEHPGKVVYSTVTLGTLIIDAGQEPGFGTLRPDVPGYIPLAMVMQTLMASKEGGAPLGGHNKVAMFDSMMPGVHALQGIISAGHMPRCQMGTSVLFGAVEEILRQHADAWEPDWLGEFRDFNDYMLSGGVLLNGNPMLICMDVQGRRCLNPQDFLRASQEKAFPVRYFSKFMAKPEGWVRVRPPVLPIGDVPAAEPAPVAEGALGTSAGTATEGKIDDGHRDPDAQQL